MKRGADTASDGVAAADAARGTRPRLSSADGSSAAPESAAAVVGPSAGDARASEEAIEAEVQQLEANFDGVLRNRVACLGALCQLAQRVERIWDADVPLRRRLLETLAGCLAKLEGHKDKAVRELSSLAPKISADVSLRHLLTIALPIERQHTRGLRDHEFLVLRPDDLTKLPEAQAAAAARAAEPAAASSSAADACTASDDAGAAAGSARPRLPLTVVLDNLRSAFNVGSVFRTAEALQVQELVLCGYTATPEESKGQTGRAAMGADALVPWRHHERTADAIRELRERGVPVFALETVAGAASVHEYKFPSPCALVLGNERHGLEADVISLCVAPVRIPCLGVKNSLNVGVAFAICGFELARQWSSGGGGSVVPADAAGA